MSNGILLHGWFLPYLLVSHGWPTIDGWDKNLGEEWDPRDHEPRTLLGVLFSAIVTSQMLSTTAYSVYIRSLLGPKRVARHLGNQSQ
jgi:hypothetical protein